METFDLLLWGLASALQPNHLFFALVGCLIGTLVGVLPGVGPVAGTAILVPVTFSMDPTSAIIMLSGIYYGAMNGGTITSVLVNVPGEAASAITCLDGYSMAKAGRAGPALAVAAFGSFVGGTIATLALVMLAMPLTRVALSFGPPEFFALMMIGLALVAVLAGKSMILGLMSAVFGLLISLVGIDPVMGGTRFTFGNTALLGGISIVPVAMGLFGVSEILDGMWSSRKAPSTERVTGLMPSREDVRRSAPAVMRGSIIGTIMGLIPGMNAFIPTVMSYVAERRVSKTPEQFGKGMIEGVAGPETANNAYANAALIPLFTLGVPGSPTIAVLMGAFLMNGLTPGPLLFVEHADVAWTIIASLFVGNLILVILNVPMIPLWVSLLRIPRLMLNSAILALCILGVYTVNNSAFDILLMAFFGLLGVAMKRLGMPAAPMILTVVLGPLLEQSLRQSLEISQGSAAIFFTRPVTAVLLGLACFIFLSSVFRIVRKVRGTDAEV